MAGGYTHVTIVQIAAEEIRKNPELLYEEHRLALSRWLKFLLIGSMGPDYPYLDVLSAPSEAWATAMHTPACIDVIRECVRLIRPITAPLRRQKCVAWLFGFGAHCVTDGVVHPVVNLKVGPYEQNKTAHRRCEMSQDVLAHRKLKLGSIDINAQLSLNVTETAADGTGKFRLDEHVAGMWASALNTVFRSGQPTSISLLDRFFRWANTIESDTLLPPDPDAWHREMRRLMRLAESGGRLMPFARHIAANAGLTYPVDPEPQYVSSLAVPGERTLDFDAIFTKTVSEIITFWQHLSGALQGQPSPLDSMAGWSLDEGRDPDGRLVFWS